MELDLPCKNKPAASRVGLHRTKVRGNIMAWTTPTLVEICIGLEINGYLPAEF
jgi:coenzyme PQQ precursor peptide PqqA